MSFKPTLMLGLVAAILPSSSKADWNVKVHLEEDWVLIGVITPNEIAIKSDTLSDGPVRLGKGLKVVEQKAPHSYVCTFESCDKLTGDLAYGCVSLWTQYGWLEIPAKDILKIEVTGQTELHIHKHGRHGHEHGEFRGGPGHDEHRGGRGRGEFRGRPEGMKGGPGPQSGPNSRAQKPGKGHRDGRMRGQNPPPPLRPNMDRSKGRGANMRAPLRPRKGDRRRSELSPQNLSDLAWTPLADFQIRSWQDLGIFALAQ